MSVTESVWPKNLNLGCYQASWFEQGQGTQMLRVKYGEMLVKGQIVSSPKEQKIIKLIMKLHDEGQSFRQIAKHLNDKKSKVKKVGNGTSPS